MYKDIFIGMLHAAGDVAGWFKHPLTILLVDNERAAITELQDLLDGGQHTLHHVENCQNAVSLLQDKKPIDLIVLNQLFSNDCQRLLFNTGQVDHYKTIMIPARDHHRRGGNGTNLSDSVAGNGAIQLTPRQREVLFMICQGLCNKKIAERLDIKLGTVKAHITAIFQQLGVSQRTQAMIVANRYGLDGPA